MKRSLSIDVLKLALSFMVVGIHSSFLYEISPYLSYLFGNGLFRIAVPIFLTINGYFFYDAMQRKKEYFFFTKILGLYFFWMLVYAYYWLPEFNFSNLSYGLFKTFLIGYWHLWYLPATLLSAIMVFALVRIKKFSLNPNVIICFSIFLLLVGLAIQYIGNYQIIKGLHNKIYLYRNFLFFALPFFTFGYITRKYDIQEKISTKLLLLISLLGVALLFTESNFNYIQIGGSGGGGSFDLLFSLIVACPSIFIISIKFNLYSKSKNLALIATAIYFIHPLIMILIKQYSGIRGTQLTILVYLVSLIVSTPLIYLSKRFKYIL